MVEEGENLLLMRRGLLCSHSKKTCSSVSSAIPQHQHVSSLRGKEVGPGSEGVGDATHAHERSGVFEFVQAAGAAVKWGEEGIKTRFLVPLPLAGAKVGQVFGIGQGLAMDVEVVLKTLKHKRPIGDIPDWIELLILKELDDVSLAHTWHYSLWGIADVTSSTLLDEMVAAMRRAVYWAVTIDESDSVSNREYLSVEVCTIAADDWSRVHWFGGLLPLGSCTASATLHELTTFSAAETAAKLVAFEADGASEMQGETPVNGGGATLTLMHGPYTQRIHCPFGSVRFGSVRFGSVRFGLVRFVSLAECWPPTTAPSTQNSGARSSARATSSCWRSSRSAGCRCSRRSRRRCSTVRLAACVLHRRRRRRRDGAAARADRLRRAAGALRVPAAAHDVRCRTSSRQCSSASSIYYGAVDEVVQMAVRTLARIYLDPKTIWEGSELVNFRCRRCCQLVVAVALEARQRGAQRRRRGRRRRGRRQRQRRRG